MGVSPMDKCRICLKYRKNLRSLNHTENGITFLDMMTSFINLKILSEPNIPNNLCLSCRQKLKEAYNFKIDIERSEIILSETAELKRINFNNIHDIKNKIDYKPLLPSLENTSKNLFLCDENTITYNDIVIKKIKEDKDYDEENQITVKEFLDSVKMESGDDGYDQDYEIGVEYEPNSDSDYEKYKTNNKTKNKVKENSKSSAERQLALKIPIKPIFLKDAKIKHTDKITVINKPRKKYIYPPKTSVCPICGKLLRSTYLDSHILVHKAERPFKCDECPKSFSTKQTLSNHIKNHLNDRQYKCEFCIATFVTKCHLESHSVKHSEEKNHICEVCSQAFKRKYTLSRHMLVHNFGPKTFQCDLCSRTFHSKPLLKHHMRVHTGERPFKCEICSQPYSYKHDFNRHCLKKHGVFLKRRSIRIMNEEVLQREKALMRDLALRAHGVIVGDEIPSVFKGPAGVAAFELAMKAVEAKQVPVTYTDNTYKL